MIRLSGKFIVLNSHSIDSVFRSHYAVGIWLFSLKLWLRCLGVKFENVIFSFDDFYRDDLNILRTLKRHGINNVIIFYCPGVFDCLNPSPLFKNEQVVNADLGTREDLAQVLNVFPNVEFGVHGWKHESYCALSESSIDTLLKIQIDAHHLIFKAAPRYFAFPFGRADSDAVKQVSSYFEGVYLSDNRLKITYQLSDENNYIVNRRHLELGGSLFKFVLVTLLDRYKTWRNW